MLGVPFHGFFDLSRSLSEGREFDRISLSNFCVYIVVFLQHQISFRDNNEFDLFVMSHETATDCTSFYIYLTIYCSCIMHNCISPVYSRIIWTFILLCLGAQLINAEPEGNSFSKSLTPVLHSKNARSITFSFIMLILLVIFRLRCFHLCEFYGTSRPATR